MKVPHRRRPGAHKLRHEKSNRPRGIAKSDVVRPYDTFEVIQSDIPREPCEGGWHRFESVDRTPGRNTRCPVQTVIADVGADIADELRSGPCRQQMSTFRWLIVSIIHKHIRDRAHIFGAPHHHDSSAGPDAQLIAMNVNGIDVGSGDQFLVLAQLKMPVLHRAPELFAGYLAALNLRGHCFQGIHAILPPSMELVTAHPAIDIRGPQHVQPELRYLTNNRMER